MIPFAFVFPGQGSQTVGMLDAWGEHPVVRTAVEEASDALGEDLGALIREGPKDLLSLTTNTQPVMLLAGVASYRVWMAEVGVAPSVLAGHSLGEYAALVAAGVLSLGQAVPLVRLRAQAMQDAVPVGAGAMAAVLGLDSARVIEVCQQVQDSFGAGSAEVVEAVNFNDPMQTVIAGSKLAVDAACEAVKAVGAKRALPLPVSAPFHSSLMRPAAERLRHALEALELAAPTVPVIHNVDVAVHTSPESIRRALVQQASSPVRWVECVVAIKARGIGCVLECGPGKVLSGLVKRIDPALTSAAVYDPASLQSARELLT